MPSFQPYVDIPGIEMEPNPYEQFRTDTPYMVNTAPWMVLDPTLEVRRSLEQYDNPYSVKHVQDMRDHISELEYRACGYGQVLALPMPDQSFSHLAIQPTWTDPCRGQRYHSPNGPYGGTLSSTDSSPSEYAFSPDATRHHAALSQSAYQMTYPSPAIDYTSTIHNTWSPGPLYPDALPSACLVTSTGTACNLKDVQYQPDTGTDMDDLQPLFTDPDTIQVNLQASAPEELVLSPEHMQSPTDSGLGQSVRDDGTSDGFSDAPESDTDADYTPHTRAHGAGVGSRARAAGARGTRRGPPPHHRAYSHAAAGVVDAHARIAKPGRRLPSSGTPTGKKAGYGGKVTKKLFTCTFAHYGCPATFASKNEWKRHVASQHLRLGFYRCDIGNCAAGTAGVGKAAEQGDVVYNDFNRKDLFTQHCRRMHVPWPGGLKGGSQRQWEDFERSMEAIRERCWRVRRTPPSRSGCGFCGIVFEDEDETGEAGGSWEERMEHVGRHFERMSQGAKNDHGHGHDYDEDAGLDDGVEEREDEDLTAWAIREGVVTEWPGRGCWLLGLTPPGEQVKLKNGRGGSRRRSERKTAGQLPEDDDNEHMPVEHE